MYDIDFRFREIFQSECRRNVVKDKTDDMNEFLTFLNSIYQLSSSANNYLMLHLQRLEISKNGYVLRHGQICDKIYFVNTGILRCFYNKHEKEISSWFMKESDLIISVDSFSKQLVAFENIQALEDCVLYSVENKEWQYLYRTFPEFNVAGRLLFEKYYTLCQQRLNSLLLERAKEKYDFLMENSPQIIRRVPSKYIASYIGITEETLSRIRALK